MVAISRPRSATAEYMVLSAPKTAPMAMTNATRPPRMVMSCVSAGLLGVVVDLAANVDGQTGIGCDRIFELLGEAGESDGR